MSNIKYILTKYETIRRTEKVEYLIDIPNNIVDKTVYADEQVLDNNYKDFKVVDIVDSERLDEEIFSLRKV
ncbi:hypothetical protein ACFLUX_01995 [Chloroflexota bacterium]